MKHYLFFVLASLVILAVACPVLTTVPASISAIPATPIPATSVLATNTPAVSPAAPTDTVAPQNLTIGPYLVFLRDQGNGQELVMMDADGKGQVALPFPLNKNIIMPRSLSDLVSPDGVWLAFYTGSAGNAASGGTGTADLTLNLMSLGITSLAGSTKVVSRLLSADYPANFAQAARELGRPDITAQDLKAAFVYGITQSVAWSPDGLHLAFAGQMDGLSTDLYLYNAAAGTIQRLSSGPEQVQWIAWSPDGKWILDGSSYLVGEGMTYNLYATSLDGKTIRQLLADYHVGEGPTWINAHAFLAYQNENGPGNYGLERVDIESGIVDKIWAGSFSSKTVDATGNWLALQVSQDGLYLINLATLASTKVRVPDATHTYGTYQDILGMGSEPARAFLTRDETDGGLYFLSTGGVLTSAGTAADLFSVSPDQAEWIAIKADIQVFPAVGSRAGTYTLPVGTKRGDFSEILWRPDSSGIFLVSNTRQLYALDFSSGVFTLVEQYVSPADPVTGVPLGLIWVRK